MSPITASPELNSLSRAETVLGGIIVTVLLLLPALAVPTFRYYQTDFAPSGEFEPAAVLAASMAAVAAFLVWGHAAIQRIQVFSPVSSKFDLVKAVGIALAAPCICGGLWYSAMGGPVAYAMHQRSSPTSANLILKVKLAKTIGRTSCRYQVVLENDNLFFQRRLCGISKEQYFLLERGGYIELVASNSNFGILVSRYGLAHHR